MSLHRLARVLGLTVPGWSWYTPHGHLQDDRLSEVTITRGEAPEGLATSTMEVRVTGALPPVPNSPQSCNLTMTTPLLRWVSDRTGLDPEVLRYRFVGRLAEQTVTDTGRGPRDTRSTCSDWAAMIGALDPPAYAFRADPTLGHLYLDLWDEAGLPTPPLALLGNHGHLVVFGPDDSDSKLITASDIWDSYAAVMGTLVRTTRAGQPQALGMVYRRQQAEAWETTTPVPLHRTQVLSPVEWTFPAAIPTRLALRWRDATTQPQTTTLYVGDERLVAKAESRDTTGIQSNDGGTAVLAAGNATVWRSAPASYQVRHVTVDLLLLLTRGWAGDARQAHQLLALEAGDPIALSYDWPDGVAGVQYATTITERITADSWTLELELVPAYQITGTSSPPVRGTTWDTAHRGDTAWDATTRTWNQT